MLGHVDPGSTRPVLKSPNGLWRPVCLPRRWTLKPYEFIRFGARDVTKPYDFSGFGARDVTKPYEFIGFGARLGPNGLLPPANPSEKVCGGTPHLF